MLYGSGEYDVRRAVESYPAPRVRPEAVEIAGRHRGQDMRTCMDAPRQPMFGRQAQSMNVTQTCGPMRNMNIRSPILVDPTYNGGKYSNRSVRPVPRVKPEAEDIAYRAKGSMDVVMGQYGRPDPAVYGESRGAENINPGDGPLRKAGVRGPILVDPIYNQGKYTGRSSRPVPRVKSEASEIAEKSRGCVQNLLKTPDVRQFTQAKPKKESVDHGQANVNRMRKIQRQSRDREREKEQNKPTPVKALWKSSRYESIESKVKTKMEHDGTPRAPRGIPPRPSSAPPSHGRPNSAPARGRDNVQRPQTPLTPNRQAERRAENFIARNARLAKTYKPQRSVSQMEVDRAHDRYNDGLQKYSNTVKGTTPAYLQARQRDWARAEQERIRSIPDPTVPDGHTVLPDRDRKETLQVLRKTKHTESTKVKELYPSYYYDGDNISVERKEKKKTTEKVEYSVPVASHSPYMDQRYLYEEDAYPGNEYRYEDIQDSSPYYTHPGRKISFQREYPNEYSAGYNESDDCYTGLYNASDVHQKYGPYYDFVGNVIHGNTHKEIYQPTPPSRSKVHFEMDEGTPVEYYTEDHTVFDQNGVRTEQEKRKSVAKYHAKETGDGYTRSERSKNQVVNKVKVTKEFAPENNCHPTYTSYQRQYYPYQSQQIGYQNDRNYAMNPNRDTQYYKQEYGSPAGYQETYHDEVSYPKNSWKESLYRQREQAYGSPNRVRFSQRPATAYHSRKDDNYNSMRHSQQTPYRQEIVHRPLSATPHENYHERSTDRQYFDSPKHHVRFAVSPATPESLSTYAVENSPQMHARRQSAAARTTYRDEFQEPVISDDSYFDANTAENHKVLFSHAYQVELLQEYRFLPVRSADSIGVRQRKTELERRIAEVDEAVKVFEKPRVFVKMDE